MSVPGKCARFQGNSRETFVENGGCSFLSYREKIRRALLTNLQRQQHFNWFRLDSDGAHKMHTVT